jgi:hypothetical protein
MIKKAIMNTIGAGLFGFILGLALCFYDYAGRVYFAPDFVPNAVILGGIFAAVAWVSAFWEN